MASFTIGVPITTDVPFIQVDAGLKPGRHLFQLVVATADGRISRPDQAVVTVSDSRIITPRPVIPEPVIGRPVIRRTHDEHDQPPA